jgi:RHS repeat-associated protein
MITHTGLQESSLNAVWCAYLSVVAPLPNTEGSAITRTNVGHAFLNARFYDSSRGQFLSEDPVFVGIGNSQQVKQLTRQEQYAYLSDPQQLNAYAYGRGNPIVGKDPSGLAAKIFEGNLFITSLEYYGYYDLGRQYINSATKGWSGLSDEEKAQIKFDTSFTGLGSLSTKFVIKGEATFLTVGGTALQAIDAYCSNCSPPGCCSQCAVSTLPPARQVRIAATAVRPRKTPVAVTEQTAA